MIPPLRPPSHSPLANSSSTSSSPLRKRLSSSDLRKPIPSRTWTTPTLVELMQAELEREELGETGIESFEKEGPAESANLFPPLYGRPGRSPSPDIFA